MPSKMSTTSTLLEALALNIRDHELQKARAQLNRLGRRSSLVQKEFLKMKVLKAALDIKSGKPHLAAATFTDLLEEHKELANDSIFLANCGCIFTLLRDESRARLVFALVPEKGNIREEQADVWLMHHLRQFYSPSCCNTTVEPEKKAPTTTTTSSSSRAETMQNSMEVFRDDEAALIVQMKKEIALCSLIFQRDNDASKIADAIERLNAARQKICEPHLPKSRALMRLNKKAQKMVCDAVLLSTKGNK